MLQPHLTNVPEILRLQELNMSFIGPREVLDYEIGALDCLVGKLVSFAATTVYPASYHARRIAGERIDYLCEGVAYVGTASTQYNHRCGKFMVCLQLSDFWKLDLPTPKNQADILQEAASIVTATAIKSGPITVPLLAVREFVVER